MINKLRTSFKNLFKTSVQTKEADPELTIDTKELDKTTTPVDTKAVGYSSPLINVGYGLSAGKQRNHNEDAFFTLTTMFSYNETELPLWPLYSRRWDGWPQEWGNCQ